MGHWLEPNICQYNGKHIIHGTGVVASITKKKQKKNTEITIQIPEYTSTYKAEIEAINNRTEQYTGDRSE